MQISMETNDSACYLPSFNFHHLPAWLLALPSVPMVPKTQFQFGSDREPAMAIRAKNEAPKGIKVFTARLGIRLGIYLQ